MERFNRTLVSSLRHYLADNQRDWDQFTDALTYGYNCTVNRMIGMKPFDLVLSRTPSPLPLPYIRTGCLADAIQAPFLNVVARVNVNCP